MARVTHTISEHDVVTLREPIGTWPAGRRGTVVSDYRLGMFLVEISNSRGEMLDLIVVHADELVLEQRWPPAESDTSQS